MNRKRLLRFSILGLALMLLLAITLLSWNYPLEYIYRVQVWQASDAFDWQKFPSHPLKAAQTPFYFEAAPDPGVARLFEQLAGAGNWENYLTEKSTQSFIVVKNGKVVYENYFNGTRRDSIVTSFSVAKSFTSALIGIAIQEGYIDNVEEPITNYLPELTKRDPNFSKIRIKDLLRMSSGLRYVGFQPSFLNLNNDDNLTSYYTNQRKLALENTQIIDPPGVYFQYNKYHPQLLGMILERATGIPVTTYLQTRIWDKLGMEYDASWSTDSRTSGFEKMETGVNARAIDFAKFGVLYLNNGGWQGNRIISENWVRESTQPVIPDNYYTYYPFWFASLPGRGYYGYMWWGMTRENDAYDFTAQGDKGQFIYVSPSKNLVIIRNGIEDGISFDQWEKLFYQFASEYQTFVDPD